MVAIIIHGELEGVHDLDLTPVLCTQESAENYAKLSISLLRYQDVQESGYQKACPIRSGVYAASDARICSISAEDV
jgi:hypothetical protein